MLTTTQKTGVKIGETALQQAVSKISPVPIPTVAINAWVNGTKVDVKATLDQLVKGTLQSINPVAGAFGLPDIVGGLGTAIGEAIDPTKPSLYIANYRLGPYSLSGGLGGFRFITQSDCKRFSIPIFDYDIFTQGAAIGTILGCLVTRFKDAFSSGLSPAYFQPFLVSISSGENVLPRSWIPLINACVAEYKEISDRRTFYMTSPPSDQAAFWYEWQGFSYKKENSLGLLVDYLATKKMDMLGHVGPLIDLSHVPEGMTGMNALSWLASNAPPMQTTAASAPVSFKKWVNSIVTEAQNPQTFGDLLGKYNLEDWFIATFTPPAPPPPPIVHPAQLVKPLPVVPTKTIAVIKPAIVKPVVVKPQVTEVKPVVKPIVASQGTVFDTLPRPTVKPLPVRLPTPAIQVVKNEPAITELQAPAVGSTNIFNWVQSQLAPSATTTTTMQPTTTNWFTNFLASIGWRGWGF